MIAVQTISTSWTKSSRGGSLAMLRNCVPKRLPLSLPDDLKNIVWHSVAYSECNRFAAPISVRVTGHCEDNRYGCKNAEVERYDDYAILTYRYQTGAPARQFFGQSGTPVAPEHSIKIPWNRWASVEYNGRFACIDTGNWWYERVVINVACGDSIPFNCFRGSEPFENYTQLAILH